MEHFGYIEVCDLCGSEYPIHKCYSKWDNKIWIEYTGKQWLCNFCREDKEKKKEF